MINNIQKTLLNNISTLYQQIGEGEERRKEKKIGLVLNQSNIHG